MRLTKNEMARPSATYKAEPNTRQKPCASPAARPGAPAMAAPLPWLYSDSGHGDKRIEAAARTAGNAGREQGHRGQAIRRRFRDLHAGTTIADNDAG